MSSPPSLQKATAALESSLRSIDVRAAVKMSDGSALSLLTAIRISARSVDVVRSRHVELERQSPRPSQGEFRILFDALPFAQLSNILEGLTEASLDIKGCHVSFPQAVEINQLLGYHFNSQLKGPILQWGELQGDSGWPGWYYYPNVNRTVTFQDRNIYESVERLGWPSAEGATAYFLEVDERDFSSRQIPFFIFLTIPAKVTVQSSETKSFGSSRLCGEASEQFVRVLVCGWS